MAALTAAVDLSVVVVNWNSRDDLRACLASLRDQRGCALEVIVVDNGSTDGSADMVAAEFTEARLIRATENLGFAEGCNRGIAASGGAWVAMLNNDAVAEPDWARALADAAAGASSDCGMLQSLQLFLDRPDVINSTGLELTRSGGGRDRSAGRRRSAVDAEAVFCPTAGAAAYRRSALDAVRLSSGWFDRDYFMYLEDFDLGWRARLAGWDARYVASAVVRHKYKGSAARRGRSWLVRLSRTNRICTLVKNASVPFLVATAPRTAAAVVELLWHGGPSALVALSQAVRRSLALRAEVSMRSKRDRRAVERAWVS
ncbi:MAG TPA: glycosyltransferase family 2 protein [Vicinamibacterales bacterium]|nr:glycosyltransferase family 2 protein [Vicinamibacterales bacterium]